MIRQIKNVFKNKYQALNIIELSESALKHNYLYLNSLDEKIEIAPVLKSNAYGHGIVLIAKILDKFNPPFFCVDSLYEGYELLKINIKTKILVMGYFHPESLNTKLLPFSYAVFTYEQINAIQKYQPQANIHVFVDTGMHREGIMINELQTYIAYIQKNTNLNIEGLMTHLAMSEKPYNSLTEKQIASFKTAQNILANMNVSPKWIHMANSSGILNHSKYKSCLGNISRSGLVLYGIDPTGNNNNLNPILELNTHIAQVKIIKKGESVGYNYTYTAKRNMKIAVLPLGYNDGIDRSLSNTGYVKISNKLCKIIGRVSMNITTIDVSNIPDIQIGQEVVVYSNNKSDKNSIENSSKIANTIPYDILVHLTPSMKRIII